MRFDKQTMVLRFPYKTNKSTQWILFPMFAWRVIAPQPIRRKINLFQRAVLHMIYAKVDTAKEIAKRLHLHWELVALVFLELENMGLVDACYQITSKGKTILDEISNAPPFEMKLGHVFANPFDGKLWPRLVVEDLPIAEVDLVVQENQHSYINLLSGSHGDPWIDRTYSIVPRENQVLIVQPRVKDIVHASWRHRRQRRFDEMKDGRAVPEFKRVEFISSEPTPYFIALQICRNYDGDWMALDPFGHGESIEIRRQIEPLLDKYSGLRNWIERVKGQKTETATIIQLQKEAEWEVEKRLTIEIRNHNIVYQRLVAMHRSWMEVQLPDAPKDKLDDTCIKAQRCLERVFRNMLSPYMGAEPPLFSDLTASNKTFNQEYLNAIAGDIGFETPLSERLSSVKRGKIQYAEESQSASLRPFMVLALLCADRCKDFPLHRIASADATFLNRLNDLASARDYVAHDGYSVSAADVEKHIETVYFTVEQIVLKQTFHKGV